MRIQNPYIYNIYYPLPCDKYIIFHFSGKDNLRNYGYWSLVIEELKRYLGEYKFIQVGVKDDPTFPGIDIDLRDKCSMKQSAYVIKNASLFIGVDSFPIHVAAYYKVPCVGLYANSFTTCVEPVWGDKSKQRLLSAHRLENEYPSFSFHEEPKTVDRVKPEEIIDAALELMEIDKNEDIETIFIGDKFNQIVLELIPNQIVPKSFNPEIAPYIRYDLGTQDQENNVYNQVFERKCIIVTDKNLNIDMLKKLRSNVVQVVVEIKDVSLVKFVKELHFSGINYALITYLDDAILNKIKLDFADYNLIIKLSKKTKDDFVKDDIYLKREWSKMTDFSDVYFKTGKYILSDGKIYLGYANYKNNKPLDNQQVWYKFEDFNNIDINNLFWEDGDFMIMQKRKKLLTNDKISVL